MSTPEDQVTGLADLLASQPSETQLFQALTQFQPQSSAPNQSSSAVIFTLVNTTIPSLWRSLSSNPDSKPTIRLLIECLSSVAGVNALLMRLDSLHTQSQKSSSNAEQIQLADVMQVLTLVLEGNNFSPMQIIRICQQDDKLGRILFNEYAMLVGGSRILNVVGKVAAGMDEGKRIWVADGKIYSRWLGKRIAEAIRQYSEGSEIDILLGKALSLGYPCNSFPAPD